MFLTYLELSKCLRLRINIARCTAHNKCSFVIIIIIITIIIIIIIIIYSYAAWSIPVTQNCYTSLEWCFFCIIVSYLFAHCIHIL